MSDLTIQKIRDMLAAHNDGVYLLSARENIGEIVAFLLNSGWPVRPPRILTEHQLAVEEAAGMNLDWGMAAAYEAGSKS
jgi:hypothetical protein